MDFDIPSSQETVEAPVPGSSSDNATVTLTPSNAEARWAFHEVADWLQGQSPDEQGCRDHTRKCMWIAPTQQFDPAATRVARRMLDSFSSSSSVSSPRDVSSSPGHPKSENAVEIWTGHYFLSIHEPPRLPQKGWTVGSLRTTNFNDIVLTLSPKHNRIRQRQATFQIHETGLICLRSGSERATTSMNGSQLSSRDVAIVRSNGVELTFGTLCYRLEYVRGSRAEGYTDLIHRYLTDTLGTNVSRSTLALTPTPSEQGSITVGKWTLTAGTIGVGGSGRVSVGMDKSGKLVALKRIHVSKNREQAQQRRSSLETLAALCKRHGEQRILSLVEVITDDMRATNDHADWWFVLDPVVESTLVSLHVENRLGDGNQRVSNTRKVLTELLGATQFLHKHGWIHGDIKPPNVGIRNWPSASRSIVLLDLDDAQKSPPPAKTIPPRPGTGGTIGWLAPERELEGYDETVDVWSIGVLALWMINRRSPWGFSENPWNPDPNCARLRPAFQRTYKDCTVDLDLGDMTLRNVILGMLRYPYAETPEQRLPRFTSTEALDCLLEDRERFEHLDKRRRAA